MQTERHTLVSGETIEFPPPRLEVARFLARVRTLTEDPARTESDLVELVYGPENPLLEHGVLPNRGLVTRATFADPVYHVMLDLIDVKRIQRGIVDPTRLAARYTMTVSEAAERLGISTSAVRHAITTRTMAAWRHGSRWLLDPATVEAYRVTGRRPPSIQPEAGAGAELAARVGSAPGASFSVKAPSDLVVVEKHGHTLAGRVPAGWHRLAVKAGAKEGTVYFELEPGPGENVLERDGFYLRGRFQVIREIVGHAPRASQAFKAFLPE